MAIILVTLFHMGAGGPFRLGWLGVELFFVLSGFLITRILLEARDRPGYFRDFYIRRALRIFPIYYLTLAVAVLLVICTHEGWDSLSLTPYYLTYTQTIPQVASQFTRGLPRTAHTWTLAIEEQFYWIWPLVVLFARGRRLWIVLGTCFLGALMARLVLMTVYENPFFMFAVLPVQVDTIAAGALLALARHEGLSRAKLAAATRVATVAGGLGLCVLVALSGTEAYHDPLVWARQPHNVFLISAAALLGVGTLSAAIESPRWLKRLLSSAPLARIGKVSYGLYLYQPLLVGFLKRYVIRPILLARADWHWLSPVLNGLGLLVLYGFAELSWWLIEARCLALKDRLTGQLRVSTTLTGSE